MRSPSKTKNAVMRQRKARPVGGRDASGPGGGPEGGPEQVELDDHGVVDVVEGDQLVALVGERGASLGVVAANLGLAVVDVAGGNQLVAGMRERADRRVAVVG